jgi:hypothetical protein
MEDHALQNRVHQAIAGTKPKEIYLLLIAVSNLMYPKQQSKIYMLHMCLRLQTYKIQIRHETNLYYLDLIPNLQRKASQYLVL